MTDDVFDIAATKQRWDRESVLRRRVSRRVSSIVRRVDANTRGEYVTGRGSWTQWIVRPPVDTRTIDAYHTVRMGFSDAFGASKIRDPNGNLLRAETWEIFDGDVGMIITMHAHAASIRVRLEIMWHEEASHAQ